jgi:hypothetical protein
MTNQITSLKKNPYSELTEFSKKKGKLILSQTVIDQIKYLCSKMPLVEWSGVLYHTSEGDLQNPEQFTCKAEYILLLDKGTSGYTEYDFSSPSFTEALMEKPELMEWSMSHIHSHNNMAVFFSATDNEELTDNAPNYNYYLSLIVNNKNEYCARIAFIGEIEGRTIKFKDRHGVEQMISSPNKQVTFYYEMEIFAESSNLIDDFFVRQYKKVIAAKPVQTFPTLNNKAWDDNYENYGIGYNKSFTQNNYKQGKLFDEKNKERTEDQLTWDSQAVNFIKRLIDINYTIEDMPFYFNYNQEYSSPLHGYLDSLIPKNKGKFKNNKEVKEFIEIRINNAHDIFEFFSITSDDYDNTSNLNDIWIDCINFLKVSSFRNHPTTKLIIEEMDKWVWE